VLSDDESESESEHENENESAANSSDAHLWRGRDGRWFIGAKVVAVEADEAVSTASAAQSKARPPSHLPKHRLLQLRRPKPPSPTPHSLRSQPGCGPRPPVGLAWWRCAKSQDEEVSCIIISFYHMTEYSSYLMLLIIYIYLRSRDVELFYFS